LETVSTVRGSGWVAVPKCGIAIDYKYDRFTHPLPRTVLTVSKCDFGLLRQSHARIEYELVKDHRDAASIDTPGNSHRRAPTHDKELRRVKATRL
jgi:hypothetical protein